MKARNTISRIEKYVKTQNIATAVLKVKRTRMPTKMPAADGPTLLQHCMKLLKEYLASGNKLNKKLLDESLPRLLPVPTVRHTSVTIKVPTNKITEKRPRHYGKL